MDPIPANGYVPVLIAKQGERKALTGLPGPVREAMTPVFVAPPIELDLDTGQPKKTITEHLAKLPDLLADAWTAPAFIDADNLPDDPVDGGEHALEFLVRRASEAGLALTPIVAPTRTAQHLDAARRVLATHEHREIGLRIAADEWPAIKGYGAIDGLLGFLGLRPEQVHLMLDLGDETGPVATSLAVAELRSLRAPDSWKSLVVVGTGIPTAMPPGRGLHEIERTDWALYSTVRATLSGAGRVPTFGDYGIAGASLAPEIDPRLLSISGTIRYTVADRWLVAKGGLYKGPGGSSMGAKAVIEPAGVLLKDPRFAGVDHCATEKWIEAVATETLGAGTPTTWRDVGTHHHLTFVTRQIAMTFGP